MAKKKKVVKSVKKVVKKKVVKGVKARNPLAGVRKDRQQFLIDLGAGLSAAEAYKKFSGRYSETTMKKPDLYRAYKYLTKDFLESTGVVVTSPERTLNLEDDVVVEEELCQPAPKAEILEEVPDCSLSGVDVQDYLDSELMKKLSSKQRAIAASVVGRLSGAIKDNSCDASSLSGLAAILCPAGGTGILLHCVASDGKLSILVPFVEKVFRDYPKSKDSCGLSSVQRSIADAISSRKVLRSILGDPLCNEQVLRSIANILCLSFDNNVLLDISIETKMSGPLMGFIANVFDSYPLDKSESGKPDLSISVGDVVGIRGVVNEPNFASYEVESIEGSAISFQNLNGGSLITVDVSGLPKK